MGAFATTGAEDVEEGHFSADFMSKLERLIGKDFKSGDFGIDRESGLVNSGRPLTARRITAILSHIDRVDEAGRNMRKCGIDKLGDQSSAAEIHRALENFAKEVDRVGGKNKDLVRTRLVQSAIASLPEDSKRALAAALGSAAGQNLLGFYNAAAASQNRNKDFYFGVVMQIVEQLRTSLELPNDDLPLPSANEYDVKTLPPAALVAASPAKVVSGDAVPEIKQRFVDFAARHGADATKVFRDRMNKSVETNIVNIIAQKLGGEKFDAEEDNNQFKMDLARDLVVFVPDGDGKRQLPKNYGEARDDLLKFVTGNAAATWQNASKADKTKVAIMMACVNQGTYAVAQLAMLDAIDETRQSALSPFDFMNEKGAQNWTFEFSRADNGDIKVRMYSRRNYCGAVTCDAQRNMNITDISEDSFEEFDCEITFPADNLDSLSRADWRRYDPKKAKDIYDKMGDTPKSRERQAATVPKSLRFAGTADMSLHLHIA